MTWSSPGRPTRSTGSAPTLNTKEELGSRNAAAPTAVINPASFMSVAPTFGAPEGVTSS